jgi:predicted nucleic acid-binding protein
VPVKVVFDTSVLVAALLTSHRDHPRAIVWLSAVAAGDIEGAVSVHALGEVWSVLTKLPVTPPIAPAAARLAIGDILSQFETVSLTTRLYVEALDRCVTRGLRSGAIFDALHLATAEAAGAEALVTFNAKDFTRLALPSSPRIVVPPDPPAVAL